MGNVPDVMKCIPVGGLGVSELAVLIALLFFIAGMAVGYFMRGDHDDHLDGIHMG